jgi:2-polyprenyl-3-methyl-5-hydroxy-6-metoxy-1,4-benzoquinol methylase
VVTAATPATACVACIGAQEQVVRSLAGYEVLRCSECGTVSVSPMPIAAVMHDFYDGRTRVYGDEADEMTAVARESGRTRVYGPGVEELKTIGRECMQLRLAAVRRITGRPVVDMVEIGCGPGFYLHGAKALGLKVRGLDLDGAAVEFARNELGLLDVDRIPLEHVSWAPESADLVLLSQLIEHIPDPTDLLARVRRLLRPGGVLIVETPNARTLEHLPRRRFLDAAPQLATDMPELGRLQRYVVALRRPWSELDPPRHVRIYTAKGLATLLNRMGFETKETGHYMLHQRPYYFVTQEEWQHMADEERAARTRLRRRSLAAYLGYIALWNPAMALLRRYCRWSGRGVGLIAYGVRTA